jgi:nanoRNase/pAp phosphatase (c-di-AMP/oligoRNAs hydrolase)
MTNPEILKKIPAILEKINIAKKILIMSDSARPDWDCYATALAIREWLEAKGKEVSNATLIKIPEQFSIEPKIANIHSRYAEEIGWEYFDLVICIDTSSFSRMFGAKYREIILQTTLDKIINIDHHEADDIEYQNPNMTIRDSTMISTSQVFYEYFLKTEKFDLTKSMADLLYLAHCSDSQRFMFKSENDSLNYGQILINAGADFNKVNEQLENLSKTEWEVFRIFLEHMEFWEAEKTLVLKIDNQLENQLLSKLGKPWHELGIDEIIKTKFFGKVTGYNIGLVIFMRNQNIKVSYRVRNSTNFIIAPILELLGMSVGGHQFAGSASGSLTIEQFERKFREIMSSQ